MSDSAKAQPSSASLGGNARTSSARALQIRSLSRARSSASILPPPPLLSSPPLPPLAAPVSYAAVARTAVPSAVPPTTAVPTLLPRTAPVTSAHLDAARLHAAATAGARSGSASLSLPAAFAAHRRQADALSLARSLCAGAVRATTSALSAPALPVSPSAPLRVLRSANWRVIAQPDHLAPSNVDGIWRGSPLHPLHPETKTGGVQLLYYMQDESGATGSCFYHGVARVVFGDPRLDGVMPRCLAASAAYAAP